MIVRKNPVQSVPGSVPAGSAVAVSGSVAAVARSAVAAVLLPDHNIRVLPVTGHRIRIDQHVLGSLARSDFVHLPQHESPGHRLVGEERIH